MQSEQPRRVLPPGIEDDVVFGVLWIRVGLLKTIKATTNAHKVNIQFWGQASPATLYTSQTNQLPLTYQVKCPITFFQKYLLDMKKNLKIEVQNLGNVFLDLSSYLKKDITLATKNPFDHFKGFFEVIGKQNKKVGSVQLQLSSTFNPQIALIQLQDDQKQQICPANNIKNCQCKGLCKCISGKINAVDVLAVQKPALFRQFYEQSKEKASPVKKISYEPVNDNRIPNSLNNVPNKGVFDPNRYSQAGNNTPKGLHIFPTVQKILTYSNLKLKKEQEPYKQSSRPMSIKQNLQYVSQAVSKHQIAPREEVQSQQRQKPSTLLLVDKKPSQRQLKKKGGQTDIPINAAVQNQNLKEVHLSDVSEVQKMDQSVSVQAQKQILSRVINLNVQLQKQRLNSPIKNPLKTDKPKFMQQPYQNTNINILSSPPNLVMNPPRQKRKHSSLLLNMVIQLHTNTVTFAKATKFILSYRPYGQKDNIRNGPQLPQTFLMMFPVGQPQIAKMNKIPFILQFWGANEGQLLGVIKLSLLKIQKGFILDGRLNELAIKTSLLPTVIYNGTHPIISLTDKPVGECYLSARIGTPAQIQSYLNSPKPQSNSQIIPPPRQREVQQKKQSNNKLEQQKNIRKEGSFQDFTNLLQLIDSKNNISFVQHLLTFTNEKEANHQQFQSFLKKIQFTGGDIFHFVSSHNVMKCKQLSNSFEDYKKIKHRYLQYAQGILKQLTPSQLKQTEEKIKQKSNFGIISKSDLASVFSNVKLDKLIDYLGQIVQIDSFVQWMRALGKYGYKSLVVKESNSRQFIEQMLFSQCPTFMQSINSMLLSQKDNSELQLIKVKPYFTNSNKQPFSLWFWIQLSKMVYQSFGEHQKNSMVINTSLLYNWLIVNSKKRERVRQLDEEVNFKQTVKQQRENKQKENVQSVKQQPKLPQPKQLQQSIRQQSNSKLSPNELNKQNKPDISNSQEKPPIPSSQQKIIQHQFIISLQQLQLQQDLSGQCSVLYRFPFEQEQVSSRKIQLLRDKHKYKLTCTGTHKFTINQPIQKYFGESTLSVRVVMGKQGEFYGDLHSQELITKGSQFRVMPLFSSSKQGMVGRIKLKIQYLHQITEQIGLGRQTIKDVFLPKNGYLNFQMTSIVDESRLRNQFNLKEEFYIQISMDIFGQNPSLSPHFPPFHSKLYSDFSSQLYISGSFKITLSPQILQHLRGGSCQARMLIVYYAKERGNYQRKQLLIASFKAPLFAVIREEGLRGDYAFKNKLGMFVALAHSSIKYQKMPKIQSEAAKGQQNSRENFWLVMDFCQMINFEGDLGWVKFQVVTKGKRLTTEKTLIREQGSFQLDSRCLSLQMGQQQFSITKILPISIIVGNSKYCMDINLRPIAKLLGRQKYTVHSQYFIVVDDQSRPKKLRVGLKLYAFRAQANFTHFVQSLAKNCIRSDSIEQKIDNYQQEIQNIRKHLKMSGKAFDEAINQILDKRKKQKLSHIFFASKIHPSLDLSPILAYNQTDVYLLAEELSSQVEQRQLQQYIQQSGIKLVNLRTQFLQRYSFNKLNQLRLDQNVEYLGLSKQIDLLVFANKIRIQQASPVQEQIQNRTQIGHRMMRISIIRGYNFHLLYNGIMPNARICLPDIGLETQVIERSSEPIFNEHINLQLLPSSMKKLKIEVFHQASQQGDAIMIGQGTLSLVQAVNSNELPYSKVHRAVLSSLMSNRTQAALDVKIQISSRNEVPERSYSEIDQSIGDSRVEEAMERIHKLQDYKKRVAMFQSSDED